MADKVSEKNTYKKFILILYLKLTAMNMSYVVIHTKLPGKYIGTKIMHSVKIIKRKESVHIEVVLRNM